MPTSPPALPGSGKPTARERGWAPSRSPPQPLTRFPWSLHRALVFITFSLVFEKGITCTFRSVPF